MNLKDKKIIIFGGTGFLGRHFEDLLSKMKLNFSSYGSTDIDLLSSDLSDSLLRYIFSKNDNKGIVVINLAADCGGIRYNKENPVSLFTNNITMLLNVFRICYRFKVEMLMNLGTVCSYPTRPIIPFNEDSIWDGYPEATNAPYGIAKKMSIVLSDGYKKQYGFNSINLIIANMYGEYDHFDSSKGHVIPDLICKFVHAKANHEKVVHLWGTGKVTRDFLYAGDTANIVLSILESGYCDSHPINIGTGKELSIALLSYYIAKQVQFKGRLIWDESKPDGQSRRVLDISRLTKIIGAYEFKDINKGLEETINWYLQERKYKK